MRARSAPNYSSRAQTGLVVETGHREPGRELTHFVGDFRLDLGVSSVVEDLDNEDGPLSRLFDSEPS